MCPTNKTGEFEVKIGGKAREEAKAEHLIVFIFDSNLLNALTL